MFLDRATSNRQLRKATNLSKTKATIEVLEERRLLSYTLSTLATFEGLNDLNSGHSPDAPLVNIGGTLYGTTSEGGVAGGGTIFKVTPGSGTITPLVYFSLLNQGGPSNLTADASGNLYCETYGQNQPDGYYGSVFEYTPSTQTVATLATFNFTNGEHPQGGLLVDSAGNLFGTASGGAKEGNGDVFEVVAGSGTITVIHQFFDLGGDNENGVVADSAGNLYAGGLKLAAGTFTASEYSQDIAPEIIDSSGNLFGVSGAKIEEIPAGGGTPIVLATLPGNPNDNSFIVSQLYDDSAGNLFGEIQRGGANSSGSVFEVVPGSGVATTIASFGGLTGNTLNPQFPNGGLIGDSAGNLYGVSLENEAVNGVVFKLSPSGSTGNASLVATAPSNQAATAGTTKSFDLGTFGQTNATGPFNVTVNWGDGSAPTTFTDQADGTIPAQSHVYAAAGSDTVSVNISDANGQTANPISFTITVSSAPVGTTGLTLAVVRSTSSTSIVDGTALKGAVTVSLENTTGTTLKGAAELTVYASGSDGNTTLVGTAHRSLNLKNGKTINVPIPVKGTLPSGTYTLLPQFVEGGDTSYASVGPSLEVAAAQVTLAATASAVKPSTIAINKTGSLIVTLTNNGNVTATGALVIKLSPSSDGISPDAGGTLTTVTKPRVSLKAGKTGKYSVKFKVNSSTPAGVYFPYILVSFDNQSAIAIGPGTFTAG